MLRPRHEHRVDVLEVRVRGGVVDDVVARDGEALGYGGGGDGGGEEGGEEACVVGVAGYGVGLGGVGFEDGEADRGHFERVSGVTQAGGVWRMVDSEVMRVGVS